MELTSAMTSLGNISYLDQPMHAFVCSRTTRSSVILPCLDRAAVQSRGATPIISTFHSEMEVAVLDVLLRGTCPIVMVLGRRLYKRLPEKLRALSSGRLLIVSISENSRISRETALAANCFIAQKAERITVGFIAPDSTLQEIIHDTQPKNIITLK